MANLRTIKKDIDYLVNEIVYDCYLSLCFHEDKHEKIVDIMQETVDFRNNLFEMVNNPADKHNKSLVKKHFAYIKAQMQEKADELCDKLSAVCQEK